MSCLGPNYNPIVTREWNRVQNVYNPSVADPNMYAKGNVLQHLNNSARLTKAQQYSQMARGANVRKITYASQSQTDTNPNIKNLTRIGNRLVCLSSNTRTICSESYASNVPGGAILCWSGTDIPTLTKNGRRMNNSTNKWPYGAKVVANQNQ